VLPSPKSQRQAVASLTGRAVNWTGDFAAGLTVAIANAADGAATSSFAEAFSLPMARRNRATMPTKKETND
jgi:hypothetical protein